MFQANIYKNRRGKLHNKMQNGIAIILGNNEAPMNYPDNTYHFRQDSNFLYFFGIDLAGMIGVIDFDNNKDYIFANDYEIGDIIWMGPQPSVKEQAAKCGVENTDNSNEIFNVVKKAVESGRKVHFLPPYRHDNMILLNSLLGVPTSELTAKASMELVLAVVALRNIKDEAEIAEIHKACNIGYKMHTYVMKNAKAGMVERELAGIMEGVSLSYGSVPSFPIILTKNGQTLHNHYHGHTLAENDLLLVDAGAQTSMYYASDNTRTMPIGGKFTQKQREIYQAVLDANNHANTVMKPGVTYFDVHIEACKVLANGLKNLGLMKGDINEAVMKGAHALFMPHGLGHMMGLDVHDMEDLGQIHVGYDNETRPSDIFGFASLRLGRRLEKGFVLTNEPGCYFIPELIDKWQAENKFTDFINYEKVNTYRDFGGIRLEDDLLITESGAEIMGDKRIPITIEEIEDIMG